VIVVDTNALAYIWIPGDRTKLAVRVLRADPDWHAPLLWRSEFRNVLAGCHRRGLLSFDTCLEIASSAESQMRGREHTVETVDVLALARDSGCTAYDCEFVALADALAAHLVTSDSQVLEAFPEIAVSPESFLDS
jgi:predicted nucleic acid-binding protein